MSQPAEPTPAVQGRNGETTKQAEELPKLSPAEFKVYNRLAEKMDMFHNHFRQTWNILYTACSANKRPQNMSLRQFLSLGLDFCRGLDSHHSIEENYVFPILARKMPAFEKELQLLTQHKQIHAGLEKFEEYLRECRGGEKELRMEEMKRLMETFGAVLWQHLDEEVKELGAENLRKYWSIEEIRNMPF